MSEPVRINGTRYGYYVEGGNIAILEQNVETGKFDSVEASITNGLLVRYTKVPDAPVDESSILPLDESLALALVDYVKAKQFEQLGDYEKRQFHMREFLKKVMQYQKNRNGGAKIIIPRGAGVIR
tara:strand:- start:2207 stop:2581 length:375 start_codon:yes stop_codon:yes gene_type:complete